MKETKVKEKSENTKASKPRASKAKGTATKKPRAATKKPVKEDKPVKEEAVEKSKVEKSKVEKVLEVASTVAETLATVAEQEIQTDKAEEIMKDLNTAGFDKIALRHYSFIARYDNIMLADVKLDNLKCVIYECNAINLNEAVEIFRSGVRNIVGGRTHAEKEAAVDLLLQKVFGERMLVESHTHLEGDSETTTVNL